jgi:hypothetical protein
VQESLAVLSCAGDPRVRRVMGESGREQKLDQRGGRGRAWRGGPKPYLTGAGEDRAGRGSPEPEQAAAGASGRARCRVEEDEGDHRSIGPIGSG